jgi:osmoprotectant transport system permease protein
VNSLVDGVQWILTPENWREVSFGPGIASQLAYHLLLSALAVAFASAIAIPVGLYVGHKRQGTWLAVAVANVGRAIPSYGLVVLIVFAAVSLAPSVAFTMVPTMIALVFLAIPPILTNTYIGIQEVEQDTVEAARGMGLSEWQVLRGLEMPLAAPLMMAGLRTAAVTVVATATLAGFVGAAGLGSFLYAGFTQQGQEPQFFGGAILVAALAILTEVVFAGLERFVTPRTRSRQDRRDRGTDGVMGP